MVEERMVNRMLLTYMNDQRGIPASFEDLSSHLSARLRRPASAECRRGIEYLESAGYLERCEATAADEPLYKITAAGIRQATKTVKQADLDPLIWE